MVLAYLAAAALETANVLLTFTACKVSCAQGLAPRGLPCPVAAPLYRGRGCWCSGSAEARPVPAPRCQPRRGDRRRRGRLPAGWAGLRPSPVPCPPLIGSPTPREGQGLEFSTVAFGTPYSFQKSLGLLSSAGLGALL